MPATIQFNKAATEMLQGRQGGKLRMQINDGVLMVRPTDRKAGPHVLSEYQAGARGGISVQIEDKQLEKLGNLSDKTQFNVVPDKYGWFGLKPAGEGESEDGATAKVSIKAAGKSETSDAE
jgi:hypothetical protein